MKSEKINDEEEDNDEIQFQMTHLRTIDRLLYHCDIGFHVTDYIKKSDLSHKALNALHVECLLREMVAKLLGLDDDGEEGSEEEGEREDVVSTEGDNDDRDLSYSKPARGRRALFFY